MKVKAINNWLGSSKPDLIKDKEYEVLEQTITQYYIKGTISWVSPMMGQYIEYSHKDWYYKSLFYPVDNKPTHECECGAYKMGYTKPSKHHSHYCKLMRE